VRCPGALDCCAHEIQTNVLFLVAGGIDLLLQLLANIAHLPVTKSVVKSSGMGRAVGSIEKHKLCAGTPNESAIKERVQAVKDAWQASVKARKSQDPEPPKPAPKRPAPVDVQSPTSPKRVKTETSTKKFSSISSLLKKVATNSDAAHNLKNSTSSKTSNSKSASPDSKLTANGAAKAKKKSSKRVKWTDHFGGELSLFRVIEAEGGDGGEATESSMPSGEASVNWSDRKKRDRMREKELLAKVK
jgi:hypothetical protein